MTKNAEEKIAQLIELMHTPFTDNGPEETLIRCEIWGGEKCVSILLSCLLSSLDDNPPLAEFILRIFKEKCKEYSHGLQEHLDSFIKVLDYDDTIKSVAISLLVEIGDGRAVVPLRKLTNEGTPEIATEAAIGILRLKPDELENVFPILSDAIHGENSFSQELILQFIDLLGDRAKELIPRIQELLGDADQEWSAAIALYRVTGDDTSALHLLHHFRSTAENDFIGQAIADELEKQIEEIASSKKPLK